MKRLSFSRLRADRNVHQEMPSGQLSVAHQSAALKIWMRRRYMSMVEQIKKRTTTIYVLMIINFFPFENGFSYHPCTLTGDGHKGTDSSTPNFSCTENNYKYMRVSLMLFLNMRKCYRDMTRSESGNDPHNSVGKGKWSTRKLIRRSNYWEALNYTGNNTKMRLPIAL